MDVCVCVSRSDQANLQQICAFDNNQAPLTPANEYNEFWDWRTESDEMKCIDCIIVSLAHYAFGFLFYLFWNNNYLLKLFTFYGLPHSFSFFFEWNYKE